MKFALVTVAFAAAATATGLPKCAVPCFETAVKTETNCATTDIPCICANSEKIQNGPAAQCVMQACGMDVAMNQVLPAAEAMCKNVQAAPATSNAPVTSAAPKPKPTTAAAAPSYVSSSSAPAATHIAPKPSSTVVAAVYSSSHSLSSSSSSSAPAATYSPCTSNTPVVTLDTKPSPTPTPLASSNCTTPGYSKPTESPIYTAGAAALSSVGGLALLFVAALAL